jgi:hypothetical protein
VQHVFGLPMYAYFVVEFRELLGRAGLWLSAVLPTSGTSILVAGTA